MKKDFSLLLFGGFLILAVAYSNVQSQTGSNPGPRGFDIQSMFSDAMSNMERAFTQLDEGTNPEDEYFLGRAVAASILSTYRPYTANPGLTRYLNLICQVLVINSSGLELYNNTQVIILDSPEFNAFASPGGHIFITRGLAEQARSEDMLAAVIAHELAHIKLKHGINMINEMRFREQAVDMANRAAALSGSTSPATQRLMEFGSSISSMMDTLMVNGYSQINEFEADREALSLLAAAGYDPRALVEILRILQGTQSSRPGGFNTTHPSPNERISNIERHIRNHRVQDTSSYRVQRFEIGNS